ncbi:Deoxyribonuclease-1 [Nibea albiflora]|uniref:Deoxyribonuclease-1 n=1 Tax=Nibea albiflora TaxID=240163 RepID=A0ACB7EX96_NIBAL|nr:Deoxyribonuclease-1 [Nibea albiflora]
MRSLCALGLFLALLHLSNSLRLAAFNIKSFGDKKSSNVTLMDIISTIVHRYDIILIQEVRDSDLSATKRLMEHVNNHIVSEPLGRSSYKERYLFLYREQTVSVVKSYTYDDGCESCGTDTFSREPFVVMFTSKNTRRPRERAMRNFVLIPQHTSPDYAVQEVDALYDVVTDVRKRWNTNDIVLLGDFNSGCNYVMGSEWQQIRLFTDKSFHWLITDEADTTVSHTNCPYDRYTHSRLLTHTHRRRRLFHPSSCECRIVVTDDMLKGVVKGSAHVYDYMMDLSLSHSLALAVSDHFPVEVELIS